MAAVTSFAFPVIAAKSKGGPFVFFAAMMIVQLIVVATIYPETKGTRLEDMQRRLAVH
jgi:hypothetical protein